MTRAVLSALWSHWRRHPGQLVTLILGLALATALWSAVQAINSEARASYAAAERMLSPEDIPQLVARDGAPITIETYARLRRDGWAVSPVLDGRLRLGDTVVSMMGVDLLSSPIIVAGLGGGPDAPGVADLLEPPGVALAGPETAARIGAPGDDTPRIVESDQVPEGLVLTDIAIAATLLEAGATASRLFLDLEAAEGLTPLATIAPALRLSDPRAAPETDAAELTDSFHLNLTAFGLLSFAVGLFIVHGTIGLAHEQRRPMLRTLRSLGVPLRRLVCLLAIELLLVAIVAGLLGLALGYVIAAALLPDVAATLRGLYGAEASGSLTLRPAWVVIGLAMSLLGTALASAQSLWRIASLPVLASAGTEGWALSAARIARWQALGGVGLLAAGTAASVFLDGLLAGFGLLAGILMGAALLLPPILGALLVLARSRARGPVAQWVLADMRAQLPGLSLALMALMLALAANIGVGTMVSSFRLTFTGWLDQRLASDLYISTESDAQSAAVRAWLDGRVAGIVPIRGTEAEIAGQPGRIFGVVDDAIYREHWPLLDAVPDVWDRVAAGDGVLVNEQVARRAGLATGAPVSLGRDWRLPVIGIYSDYGNPNAQAIVALDSLIARHPDLPDRQMGLRVPPGELPALMADLVSDFGLSPDAMIDQKRLKALSLDVFEKTFLVTGALNVLTLGVAGFAMLTAFLTLWTMRLPQVAPVWALGLTRARLARLEVLRSLGLGALTFLLALPLGLVLAWALLAVINVEAFGWRLPMYVFPLDWARLGLLALAAAGLAAVIPARRLARVDPAALLKVFAGDR